MQAFVGAAQSFRPLQVASARSSVAAHPQARPGRSAFTGANQPLLSKDALPTSTTRAGASPLSMNCYPGPGYGRRANFQRQYSRGMYPTEVDLRSAMAASAPLIREFFGEDVARDVFGVGETRGRDQTAKRTFIPSARAGEDDGGYWLRIEIPGFPKELVKVEVKDNMLIARGEMKTKDDESQVDSTSESTETTTNGDFTEKIDSRAPLFSSSFERTFRLPKDAILDDIKAEVSDGILFISVAKKQPEEAKVISVNVL